MSKNLLYLRHNLTEEVLAEAFRVSQSAISRTIHHIESALLELEELKAPALEALQNAPCSLVLGGPLDSGAKLVFTRGTLF